MPQMQSDLPLHHFQCPIHPLPYTSLPKVSNQQRIGWLQLTHNHPEDSNSNVCRNVGQLSIFQAASTQTPTFRIELQPRKPKKFNVKVEQL
jgi:hypothetical protein